MHSRPDNVRTFSAITHIPGFDAGKFATSRAIRITLDEMPDM